MTIAEAKQEKASNSAALAITPTDNLSYFLKYSGDNLDAFPQKPQKGEKHLNHPNHRAADKWRASRERRADSLGPSLSKVDATVWHPLKVQHDGRIYMVDSPKAANRML